MSARIRAFVAPHTQLGESPLYRESDNTLHYVDVLGGKVNILQLGDKRGRRTIDCPEKITFLAFHKDGGYLVCSFSSIVHLSDDGTWSVLKQVIPDTTKERLNDAGIDTHGRLWVGSIDRVGETIPKISNEAKLYEAKGSIYRYDPDGTLVVAQKGGVMAGNGLCWSPDNRTMYHVDSYINSILAYEFDVRAGTVSNRRVVVSRGPTEGEADGLLIDRVGDLYTFIWEGGAVLKYSSATGDILQKWDINASRVTHGAWIGPEYRDLVVTTAQGDDRSPIWEGEEGGALFYIKGCDSAGLPKYAFGVGCL